MRGVPTVTQVRSVREVRAVATVAVVGAVVLALALVASSVGATTRAATSSDDGPTRIRIAYQRVPNGDLIVKHEGWLERAFGKDVVIDWQRFESGALVNDAVQAGTVDVGLVGSSPAARGIAAGIGYHVPWIFDVIGAAEALVVRDGITAIAQLRGATLATPFGSTADFSLRAVLEQAGLGPADVTLVDAGPDEILTAWQRGEIDGAYVWNPNLARLVASGGHTLITSADLARKGDATYDLAVVTDDFAERYPAAITTWMVQQDRAVHLLQRHPDRAARVLAAELGITPTEAGQQASELIFVDAAAQAGRDHLGGGLARNLFAAARVNQALGLIPSAGPERAYLRAVNASVARVVGSR